MKSSRVNHLAVWILVIYFQLQSIAWYTIFENPFMNLSKINMEQMNNSMDLPHMLAIRVFALISTAVIAYTIAILFTKLHIYTAKNGISYGIFLNLGFLSLPLITMDSFLMKPFVLSLINAGNYFLFFLISGLMLSLWKKYKKEV